MSAIYTLHKWFEQSSRLQDLKFDLNVNIF